MNKVIIKTYGAPKIRKDEILRYAGVRNSDVSIDAVLDSCLDEIIDSLTYKVCYLVLDVQTCGDICDFKSFKIKSKSLAKNLSDCRTVTLFAATIGLEIDRAIKKHSVSSPSRAVLISAIGAERIESLCDLFESEIKEKTDALIRPRFSVGYGDAPIETQKEIFRVLTPEKIGLTLNDSMLMSPTKSVTAFIGIKDGI